MNNEHDAMEWMCECGHRYGDHHFLDEDCCIGECPCTGFHGVEVKTDKGEDDA